MYLVLHFLPRPRALRQLLFCLGAILFPAALPPLLGTEVPDLQVGVARVDITPDYPVRLSGYGARRDEAEGIDQRLWAKALAMAGDGEDVSLLVTVDNIGVPADVTERVYRRLAAATALRRENFVIASSHTHNAPILRGVLPFLFGEDIPEEHQERIDRYTEELTGWLEQVSLAALADRQPARLSWGEGRATFAKNRRPQGGPVDHSVPVLAAHSPEGNLLAVLANYACHCTTLKHNRHHGDWAGYAQHYLEERYPGAVAMVSIGAGADADPHPRGELSHARRHGREIADEVSRLLETKRMPIPHPPAGAIESIELPFATLPSREEWVAKADEEGVAGHHARKNLERLEQDGTLPTSLPYQVQTWTFGDDLAMVFLPGEVVVDYALRLRRDFDRLWVTAYANDVPCYIPSERVLAEGGYEGASAMLFYDRPAPFAPGVEDRVIQAVHRLLPESFLSAEKVRLPPAVSPEESLRLIQTSPGLAVELVASEPVIVDPVAIDFGPDGKLWVAEMHDYPTGIDGNWKPGGRIKFLTDTNGDGSYDQATLFLDEVPFPTGVMAWRKGVLICAAPDILYAEDTTGDGRADRIEKLFTGFATKNYQARVNGLSYGLDNWIYGANGLLGGTISGRFGGRNVDIRGRDFRMRPETGEFEPVAGLTQQGRTRDDWGNWFGSDNSTVGWHYPLQEHYLRRNPHIAPPGQRVKIGTGPNPHRVYPISRTLERFNDPEHADHFTSACGETIYRDNLLGDAFYGNYFVTESVHNLVHRLRMEPSGVTFGGHRATGEETSEFFSSRDNWCRPVQVRTGPDGALWVVDMYRFVIEHPRWISEEKLATLDVRAGADKGRIYRIYPQGQALRPVPDFTRMSAAELVAALDTPNGPQRDLVQVQLVERQDQNAVEALATLARESQWPTVRVQALAILDGLQALEAEWLLTAARDAHPRVRQHAIRLSESLLDKHGALAAAVLSMAEDEDPMVRYQLALSLGEWHDPRASAMLGEIARRDMADPWVRAAILSSSVSSPDEVLAEVLASPPTADGRTEMIGGLVTTLAALDDPPALARAAASLIGAETEAIEAWHLAALADLGTALAKQNLRLEEVARGEGITAETVLTRLASIVSHSRRLIADTYSSTEERAAALRLLSASGAIRSEDLPEVVNLLGSGSEELQGPVIEFLRGHSSPEVAGVLLADWERWPPSTRGMLIDLLLSRDPWVVALLHAIQDKVVSGAELSATNQERLLVTDNKMIRRLAEEVLAEFRPRRRTEVLEAYKEVGQLVGRVPAGARIFKTSCAACHSFRGVGREFGPDVALFRNKNVQEFVEAILDPNAVVEPRFIHYLVETRDGRRLAGVIAEESANSLTLVQMGGVRQNLLRSEIARIEASERSMMPEGLESLIKPQDMADLIAYLRTEEPRPFGSASAESVKAARKDFTRGGFNGLAQVVAAPETVDYPGWLGRLPMAHCRQTDGKSRLVWRSDPAPEDLDPETKHTFFIPAAMGHLGQPEGGFRLKINGRPVLQFDVVLDDHLWESRDGTVRMLYEVRERNDADSNGRLAIEVPGRRLSPGEPVEFEVTGMAAGSQRWFGIYLLTAKQIPGQPGQEESSLGKQILDDSKSRAERKAIIRDHPDRSTELLREMVSDLPAGTEEEYRRIPWIWRVTIAAGRRNDPAELRSLLEIATPAITAPLTDWQAVVIGGGLINGISKVGAWPGERIEQVLGNDTSLRRRWQRALDLAAAMADDEAVPPGTRYDALRMIALQPWEERGEQLVRYLGAEVHQELQQGAVSGLGDMPAPDAPRALIEHFSGLTESNRKLALQALMRSAERIDLLLEAIENGHLSRAMIGPEGAASLAELENPQQRNRARRLLGMDD